MWHWGQQRWLGEGREIEMRPLVKVEVHLEVVDHVIADVTSQEAKGWQWVQQAEVVLLVDRGWRFSVSYLPKTNYPKTPILKSTQARHFILREIRVSE